MLGADGKSQAAYPAALIVTAAFLLRCAVLCTCRNNTSDYYVNNKRMNVKEVTSLLKSKGIDLDNNRFLILQVRAHTSQAWTRLAMLAGPMIA